MDAQLQSFNEILALLDNREMEYTAATLVAVLMRKPARAEAFKTWLNNHPEATDREVSEQAHKIAQTVEPTHHGTPRR